MYESVNHKLDGVLISEAYNLARGDCLPRVSPGYMRNLKHP